MNISSSAQSRRVRRRRLRRGFAAFAAVSLASIGLIALTASPASAATVSGVSLAVSNNAASATGVTYTWSFSYDTTTSSISSLTLTTPSGASWSSGTLTPYGLTGCSGTPTAGYTSGAVTLSNLTGCTITAGVPVAISLSGFTNPTTAVSAFQTAVTVNGGTAGTASGSISIAGNTTSVTVLVPESLTFNNPVSAITLLPVGGQGVVNAPAIGLTVSTNAAGGYKLSGCMASPLTASASTGSPTIPAVSTTTPATLGTSTYGFGAEAAVSGSAQLHSPWASSTYLGYPTSCTDPNGEIAADSAPTSGDTVTITNGVSVSATQPAGTYNGVIEYDAVPQF